MTGVHLWGPPNHAAHTAGQVQRHPSPLRAPVPVPTPRLTPIVPRPTWQDELRDNLTRALGREWRVEMWEQPHRWLMGIDARHECGFKVTSADDLGISDLSAREVALELARDLLSRERRHSCEAIRAATS